MEEARETQRRTALVCVTGCIAAYKACEIVRELQKSGLRVKVLMTEHATRFVGPTTFRALTGEKVAVGLFDDPEDPIHHISLAQEADVVLVAPATANILAKMAHGIADELMSTTLLATRAPIVAAPAMNTAMWEAPATQENVRLLSQRGVRFVAPAYGRLACGDVGSGKLASVGEVAWAARAVLLAQETDLDTGALEGLRVLITAGGTREAIDPVRYIGNRSTGKFGYALARAAASLGARVCLVSAAQGLEEPSGVEVVPVESASEMHEAVAARFEASDALICVAAVADYTPVHPADHKLKKAVEHLDRIELVETTDILAQMSARKGDRVVVGFAAETGDLERFARQKLERKGCDAIVANDVSQADSTFGADTDRVLWIDGGGAEELPLLSKERAAFEILKRVKRLLDHSRAR